MIMQTEEEKFMVSYASLRPYMHRGIEDYGAYTSPDYESFQKKYRNFGYLSAFHRDTTGTFGYVQYFGVRTDRHTIFRRQWQ